MTGPLLLPIIGWEIERNNFADINTGRLEKVTQTGMRKEGIFWQNIKKLNGFGKLSEEGNAGKKEKSWRLRLLGKQKGQRLNYKTN